MMNKRNNKARFLIMVLGNVFCGMGIGLFKLSGLGNDPYSGMMMSLADVTGMAYANFQVLANLVFFVIQVIWGRKLIGAGTIASLIMPSKIF